MSNRIISIIMAIVIFLNIFFNMLPIAIEATERSSDLTKQNIVDLDENQQEDKKDDSLTQAKIKLDAKELKLQIGEEQKIEYSLSEDMNKDEILEWTSTDESIVKVDDGHIVAVKEGKAKVVIQTKGKKIKDECIVEVTKPNIIPHIKELNEENEYKFVLGTDKNYVISNNTGEDLYIRNTSGQGSNFNIVQIYEDGSIGNLYRNENGTMWLGTGMKLKITVKGTLDVECWISDEKSESVDIVEIDTPALYEFKLEKGKTYELKNISEENVRINNSTYYNNTYHKIIYNEEGNIEGFYKYDYGNFNINTEKSKKIEILGEKEEDIECWMPYEWKDRIEYKEVRDPLFYEFKLEKGKTYEIKNTSEENVYINNSTNYNNRFHRTMYYKDGKVDRFNKYEYGNFYIESERSEKLEVLGENGEDIECWMPYEWKNRIEYKEVEGPLLYEFKLEKGKTYELKNISEENLYIPNSSSYNNRFNTITYDKDGNVSWFQKENYGTFNIDSKKSEKSEILSEQGVECYIPYEWKERIEYKEVEGPLFYEFSLERNKTYKINNNSGINVSIKNDSSYNDLYDYILYKPNATYKYLVNKYGNINLNSSEYMIIKVNEENEKENINAYLPYGYHTKGVIVSEASYDISDILDTMPKVKLNINKQLSKLQEQEEVVEVKDNLNNYNISIFNKTTNENINGWQIKGNYIVFQNGTTSPNDTISIKLDSKKRDCKVTEFNVKLDENNNAIFDAKVQQLGYIKIDEQEESNTSITNRTLIFNSEGKNIQTISANPKQGINSGYLQSDEYTVILLKSSGELWRLDSLNQFDERGFIEDTDYIKYIVEVNEGEITALKPKVIPTVDENRISFFDKSETMITSNSQIVSQNGLLEIRIQYKFKDRYSEENITRKSIKVDIPEELDFIDNSLVIDNKLSKYNISNNRETLTVPINNMSGVIKFNVKPIESKSVKISVESIFNYNNKTINEMLGIINVDINYLTINGPIKTSSKQVRVYGLAPAGKKISLYNGSEKLKDVVVLSSGKWTADIELKNAYNGSTHNIVAKIDAGTENEKVSNKLTIKYTSQMPSIKKLTMYYNNGKSINLTNYMKEGKNPVITIVPENPLTFELKLENGNENQEFYIISERNGERKSMKFTYDSKKGVWIASGFFDPNNKSYVPGTLRITYKSRDFFNDLLYINFESTEFKESLPDEWVNADLEVKKDTEDSFEFDVNLKDLNKTKVNYKYNISKIPSDITESNITSKGYIPIGNGQYLNAEDLGSILKGTLIDFTNGTMISFAAEIFNEYFETGIGGTFESLWDLFSKDGKLGDFINTNKALFECFKSSNPEQRGAIGALWTLQEMKFILGIVPSVKGFKPKVAWAPILWGAAKTVVAGMAANLAYSAADQILDKGQEKLCGGSNDLGGITGKWLIDPSGYVYEAVDSNRLEGVTTTVYYQDENGQVVKWNAEEYDQVNPLITDKEGKYAWDVPEGLWQVKYEKEGYETTYSEWLPVPPPQTEVNIGIVSLEKPNVELFNMYEDRAEITFNKYIDISSISTDSIILSDYQGKNIPITIEAINQENSKDGKELAKKFILKTKVKKTLSLENEYTLTVKNTVKTYADISSESDIVVKTIYKQLPTEIKVENRYEVNYNKLISIPVSIDDISNAEEFELIATSSMSDIAKVITEKVNFNKDGKATIKVLGQLPGEANLRFKIEGTDLESQIKVNVILPNEDNTQNTPPTIEVKDIEIKVGDEFKVLEGVTAYDEEDGDITSSIVVIENTVNTSTAGIYKVVYEVRDSNGSIVTKEIKVTVKPKFTLINRAPKIEAEDTKIKIGGLFNPLSIAKASDYEDGDITSKLEVIENNVNINKLGEYNVTYKVFDSKGATTKKSIKVTVINIGWVLQDGKWYYYNQIGEKVIGWLNENGKWYYLSGSGAMVTGWLNLNGKWYYLSGSGAMVTGWLNLNGTWYYLNGSGEMVTGWLNLNGKWYYMYGSGKMATNTIIDGWKIGSNGVATKIN